MVHKLVIFIIKKYFEKKRLFLQKSAKSYFYLKNKIQTQKLDNFFYQKDPEPFLSFNRTTLKSCEYVFYLLKTFRRQNFK